MCVNLVRNSGPAPRGGKPIVFIVTAFATLLHKKARNTKGAMTNFYLDTHPDKKGDCSIRVSIRANGDRLLTSIGYGIHPDKWDADKMQVRPGTEKSPVINSKGIPAATINARIAAIKAAFATLEATPGALSVEAARAQLDTITGKADRKAAAAQPDEGPQAAPPPVRSAGLF